MRQANLTSLCIRQTLALLLFVLLSVQFASAAPQTPKSEDAPIKADLTLDRSEILIGERVTATLHLKWTGDLRVHPLNLPTEFGAVEILDSSESNDTKTESGGYERTILIIATAFELGTHPLGPIEISWTTEAAETKTMEIDTLDINVKSVLGANSTDAGEDTILAVKPPRELPLVWRWWYGLLGLLVLIPLVLLLYFLTRRKKLWQVRAEAPPMLLDADEEALRALAEMEISGALANEPVKVVYSRFSTILRRYLGRRHHFDALEMTSEELLNTVREIGWQQDVYTMLEMDLRQTDAVKFAKYVPDKDRRQAALNRVREIVIRTRDKATLPDDDPKENTSEPVVPEGNQPETA